MIISHRYKFIFIKTRKTAGTSIEVYLSSFCGDDDIVTPIYPHVDPHQPRNYHGFYNHIPAFDVRERIGNEIWDSYFTFCVERDPWEKTLSYYHMIKVRSEKNITFEEYMTSNDFCVDYPMYTDRKNPEKIIVDRVLSYENLESELRDIFNFVGIPFVNGLNIRAKSEYRTDRRPKKLFYTQEQAKVIAGVFANEIMLFGFEFR